MGNKELTYKIAQVLTQARDEIRANMALKGINASGRTSAALQVVQAGDKIMLVKQAGNNAPFATLQYGRGAGKVPTGFRQILVQWSKDKGLSFGSESERNTFAYFLAKKIAEQGTKRHAIPQTDVYSPPISKAIEQVRKAVNEYVLGEVQATINANYT